MSTVTVVKKGSYICMAAESLTTFGPMKLNGDLLIKDRKILKWNDSLVGLVGSVAVKMIIQDIIYNEKKTPDFSSPMKIYKYFNKLHPILKEKYHLNPTEDDEDPVESSQYEMVIANKHGIFGVHALREIYHYSKYWAYGSGSNYALGAMHALYDQKGMSAEKIAIAGVEAGIAFDDGSGGEIFSQKIKLEGK